MQKLIEIAKKLYGTTLDMSKGLCFGISFSALDKFLHGTFREWLNVHRFLKNYNSESIVEDIKKARKRFKEGIAVSAVDQNLLRINAFFEEILLFQRGGYSFPDLYPAQDAHRQDYKPTNQLLYIDSIDRLNSCHDQVRIDDKTSFTSLLLFMLEVQKSKLLAYTISFVGHRFTVLPYPEKSIWYVVDHDVIFQAVSPDTFWRYIERKYADSYGENTFSICMYKLSVFSLGRSYFIPEYSNSVRICSNLEKNTGKNKKGNYLVNEAVKFNNKDLIEILFAMGFAFNKQNKIGLSPLHNAAMYMGYDLIPVIAPKLDVYLRDDDGSSALHIAARVNNLNFVTQICESMSELNAKNFFGDTALHYAALVGNLEMLSYLLSLGANPFLNNKFDRTLLHFSAISHNLDVLKYVQENFFQAVNLVDIIDSAGNTILHSAANWEGYRSNDTGIIHYLVQDLIFDINVVNKANETTLYVASQSGHTQIVQCLVELGASPVIKNYRGMSPLHVAVSAGRLDTVKILLKALDRPFINDKANNGSTPLHQAVVNNQAKVLRLLLQEGANIDLSDNKGITPLLLAIKCKSNISIIKILLNFRPNMHLNDNKGRTIFDYLDKANCSELNELIISQVRTSPQTVASLSIFDDQYDYSNDLIFPSLGVTLSKEP